MAKRAIILLAALLSVSGGCKPGMRRALPVCPGKGTVEAALAVLRSQSEKALPLKSTGTCRLEYYTEAGGKRHKEAFAVRLWLNPPAQICLHGDVALDARGLVLGANEQEFWLSIRPKKISSYWWGLWSKNNKTSNLMLSPQVVLEAVGAAAVDPELAEQGEWTLVNEGPFDVLTRRDANGVTIKKIYVSSCDYRVRRIEYFDEFGRIGVAADLDRYEEVGEGFFVPRSIKVSRYGPGRMRDSAAITLRSAKVTSFSDKQAEILFVRPRPDRFKQVYEVVGGKWIERSQ